MSAGADYLPDMPSGLFRTRNSLDFCLNALMHIFDQYFEFFARIFDRCEPFLVNVGRIIGAIKYGNEGVVVSSILGRPVLAVRKFTVIQLFQCCRYLAISFSNFFVRFLDGFDDFCC